MYLVLSKNLSTESPFKVSYDTLSFARANFVLVSYISDVYIFISLYNSTIQCLLNAVHAIVKNKTLQNY